MSELATTRRDLQRVATHVLARRRHDVTGKFGLRATPGGFGTPAFGADDAPERVRVSRDLLVHERGTDVRAYPIGGSSLATLASAVGVDLAAPFTVGHDTPPVGDPDAPLAVDPELAHELARWLDLGWQALDAVARAERGAATVQLWPEHFDAGTSVAVGPAEGDRANLGVSLGDHHHDAPYLYVSPWGDQRPGDPAFWNIGFGAARSWHALSTVAEAVVFFEVGLELLLG